MEIKQQTRKKDRCSHLMQRPDQDGEGEDPVGAIANPPHLGAILTFCSTPLLHCTPIVSITSYSKLPDRTYFNLFTRRKPPLYTRKSVTGAIAEQFAFKGDMNAGKDGDQKKFDRLIHWIGIVGQIDDAAPFQKCPGGRPGVINMGRVECCRPSPEPLDCQGPPSSRPRLHIRLN